MNDTFSFNRIKGRTNCVCGLKISPFTSFKNIRVLLLGKVHFIKKPSETKRFEWKILWYNW